MTQTENLKKYQKYLNTKKISLSSQRTYLWHLKHFLVYLDKGKLDKKNCENYREFLINKYKKIATINLRLSIINDYLKFSKQKYQLTLLSIEKQNIHVLTQKQLNEYLNLIPQANDLISLRDKILLELLYYSGFKIKTIAALEKKDLNLNKNLIVFQKQETKIPNSTKFYLLKYLQKRKDPSPYLFINFDHAAKLQNNSLSIRSIERILEKYSHHMSDVLRLNPQVLRHTLAYYLKKNGAQIIQIKKALHFQSELAAKEYFQKL